MSSPTLDQLPPAAAGRHGWPWNAVPEPPCDPASRTWPRITIVTPSFEQGGFLEETIRSVLLQGYPNLEYFVVDGGSKDGSLEILRKYEPWISWWTHEPDQGQADAINKGLRRTTGRIFKWLNSDDLLLPGALFHVAEALQSDDQFISGDVIYFGDRTEERIVRSKVVRARNLIAVWEPHRALVLDQGFFYPSALLAGGELLDPRLHFTFDHDYLIRAALRLECVYLPIPLAKFRIHGTAKTFRVNRRFFDEQEAMLLRHVHHLPDFERAELDDFFAGARLRYGLRALRDPIARELAWTALKGRPAGAVLSTLQLLARKILPDQR